MNKYTLKLFLLKIKRNYISLFCLFFIFLLFIDSAKAITAGRKALFLWLEVVIPSLFPFFVAAKILIECNFAQKIGKYMEPYMKPMFNLPGCSALALLLGTISGYPVGARITADLRKNKLISKNEAERLVAFTNNSGPIFIAGAVATGMLMDAKLGSILLTCHILGAVSVGYIIKYLYSEKRYGSSKALLLKNNQRIEEKKLNYICIKPSKIKSRQPIQIATDAVKESIYSILNIGGYIILFAVISAIFSDLSLIKNMSVFWGKVLCVAPEALLGVFTGMLEITNGINLIAITDGVPSIIKLSFISFLLGWAGTSVHFQTAEILSETDIEIKPYLIGKLFHGLFSAIYTAILGLLLNLV